MINRHVNQMNLSILKWYLYPMKRYIDVIIKNIISFINSQKGARKESGFDGMKYP